MISFDKYTLRLNFSKAVRQKPDVRVMFHLLFHKILRYHLCHFTSVFRRCNQIFQFSLKLAKVLEKNMLKKVE